MHFETVVGILPCVKNAPGQTQASDFRSRNDLAFFVLALIEGGIDTPYSLKAKAALSQGATVPVLRRLQQEGAIQALGSGTRRKKEYLITAQGKERWRQGFRKLWSVPPPTDSDAVLRIAALAIIAGVQRGQIRAFLDSAADSALRRARHLSNSARQPRHDSSVSNALEIHMWMRSVYSQKKLLAEARTYRAVIPRLLKQKR